MGQQSADPREFVKRFEALKRLWFHKAQKQYDNDGDEIPSAIDRGQLAQQFRNMGCDIPLRPEDPPTLITKDEG